MANSKLQLMDVTSLKAVIKDIEGKILPSRFEKAQQSETNTLQLGLRTLTGLTWLEICWTGEAPRLVEINAPPKIGTNSTLAKQIQHGLKNLALVDLKQKGFDRVVHFAMAKRPGDAIQKTLILELMGRHSNLFLLDQNQKIITLGRQIRNHQSRLRPISTGDIYVSPPILKGIPPNKEETFEKWKQRLCLLPITLKESLQSTYQGISPSLAIQLVDHDRDLARSILDLNVEDLTLERWEMIFTNWRTWLHDIDNKEAHIFFNGPTDFQVWATEKSSSSQKGVGLELGNYYRKNLTMKKINQTQCGLENALKKLKEEEEKELIRQKSLLENTFEDKIIQDKADSILCQNSLKKENIEEAQRLYKKAKKLRRSVDVIKERINLHKQKLFSIEESLTFLESLISIKWENENDQLNRLIELQEELQLCLIKSNKKRINKSNMNKKPLSNHIEILTPGGVVLQIGRNHRQNEFISIKKAKKGDLWFHAQECPGSHVVLKSSSNLCNESDIQIAADFAALFSRAKGSKTVSVVMAPVESLNRVQGALPGTVSHRGGTVIWGESQRALKHLQVKSSLNDLSSTKSS